MNLPIYLDYASTTPVDPVVAEKMMEFLTPAGQFGNPASRSHVFGWQAEAAVEDARQDVANLIGADPREIVWTSVDNKVVTTARTIKISSCNKPETLGSRKKIIPTVIADEPIQSRNTVQTNSSKIIKAMPRISQWIKFKFSNKNSMT